MEKIFGTLISVHIGAEDVLDKTERANAMAELDGFVGDRHRGFSRIAYEGDTEPPGTVRRNNRQWTGVAVEELAVIQERMDFCKQAKRIRGLVGSIDVPGVIHTGDKIVVQVCTP